MEVTAGAGDTVVEPSSKLTRTLFFLFPALIPSCEARELLSEVSLPGAFDLFAAFGEVPLTEDEGECLKADFMGDTDLGGGLNLVLPKGSAIEPSAKCAWADRGISRLADLGLGVFGAT